MFDQLPLSNRERRPYFYTEVSGKSISPGINSEKFFIILSLSIKKFLWHVLVLSRFFLTSGKSPSYRSLRQPYIGPLL